MTLRANAAQDVADLVHAFASFGWLALAAVLLWVLRDELRGIARRVRRLDTPVGSAEMDPEIQQLEQEVESSDDAVRRQLPAEEPVPVGTGDEILDLTAREPRLGLIRLVTEIEVRVRDLASITGEAAPQGAPWAPLLDTLVDKGVVPKGVASSSELIRSVRNRIAHGRDEEIDEREVAVSIDAGLRLLRVLDAIPREGYEVATRPLQVFSDQAATVPREDVRGVVLWDFDAQGRRRDYRIFPTRRAYSPQDRVGWQWSFDMTWPETFWRDPLDEHKIKLAWTESAEFVGQRLLRPTRSEEHPGDDPVSGNE